MTTSLKHTLVKKILGPMGLPLSGNLYHLRRDILARLLADHRKYGDVMKYRVGATRYVVLSKPEYIRHVLHEHKDNYSKDSLSNEQIRLITGYSLLTLHGDAWHQQRRRMQGAFRKGAVANYLGDMKADTDNMIHRWNAAPDSTVAVTQEMSALTYSIVGKALFGANMQHSGVLIHDALDIALAYVYRRIQSIVRLPLWGLTSQQRQFKNAVRQFDTAVDQIIDQRLHDHSVQTDLLAKLMTAVDDAEQDQVPMTRQQLRNELVTLLLAGHETTANLMAWCLFELANRPALQESLFDEMQHADLATADVEQLHRLPLLYQVIQETLRLYPPVWLMERRTLETDRIDDYEIPRHTAIIIGPWMMHRHPRYWDHPNDFNPDNFETSRFKNIPDYVFIPFGKGPRMCIGMNFAIQEAMIILAKIVQKFRFSNTGSKSPQPIPSITLRPPKDILIRIKLR